MPIITKPGSIQKNVSASITLNKSVLAVNSIVAADTYFSDSTNWNQVIINYKSPIGNQKESLIFDASLASPSASFLVSLKARDTFEVQDIIITDFDGGFLKVERANLTTTDFDISFGGGSGGSGSSGYRYYKVVNPNGASYGSSAWGLGELQFNYDNSDHTATVLSSNTTWYGPSNISQLSDGDTYQTNYAYYNGNEINIIFDLGVIKTLSSIHVWSQANGSYNVPTHLLIYGSNDNSSFTLVKDATSLSWSSYGQGGSPANLVITIP